MKSARGYVRLSGTDSEVSIPRQKQKIIEYAHDRDDLELDLVYNEGQGKSGWDATREEYQNMLSDASDGEFDVLIVRTGSRIGRDTTERLDTYFDLANKYDIEFHTCKRGFVDPENPIDVLREVFQATKDDAKKQEIEDSKEAVQDRIERGMWQGRAPLGLDHDPRGQPPGLKPNEDWNTVRELLNYKSLGYSHRETLREAGISEERSPSLLTRMLQDERLQAYEQVAENEGDWFPQL